MEFTKKLIGQQYDSRDSRNKFIVSKLKQYIGKTILNIGGEMRTLYIKIFRNIIHMIGSKNIKKNILSSSLLHND